MYDTQITIENTSIWFSLPLTGLDLYWLKCTGIHIEITENYKQLSPVIT